MLAGRLWLDVGDLFWWPHDHVTGIQRAMASIIMEVVERPPPRLDLRFCAYTDERDFHQVPHALARDRAAQLLGLPRTPLPVRLEPRRPRFRPAVRLGKFVLRYLPRELRQPTRDFCYSGETLAKATGRWLARPLQRLRPRRRAAGLAPGDLLLNIGCSWINAGYNAFVRREQRRCGLRYVVLLYDCNPYSVPHYHIPEAVTRFCAWAEDTVQVADGLLTISRYSQTDLLRFMRERGLPQKTPRVIRLADELRPSALADTRRADLAPLFAAGGYLLTLSSIAPSKNHAVIVRAMLLLLERGRRLPLFVWAGTNVNTQHIDSLLAQHPALSPYIRRTGVLDEDDLKLAFARARFTIFPSKFEGWGLPVAESLAFGKVCLASDATSIPEVGGDLADYFAPDDPARLADLIEHYLDDSALAAREAEIRRRHRRTTWAETLAELLQAVAATEPAAAEPSGVAAPASRAAGPADRQPAAPLRAEPGAAAPPGSGLPAAAGRPEPDAARPGP